MGNLYNNDTENFTSIAAVNAIIGSEDRIAPADEFIVKYSDKHIRQSYQSLAFSLVCTLLLLIISLIRLPNVSIIRFIILGAMMIANGAIIFSASLMKKMNIIVRGDSLSVNGKSYSHGDISCFKGTAFNNMKIMSDGSSLISINKSCENCGELARWAKYYDIRIDDNFTDDPQKVQNNFTLFISLFVAACVALGLLVGLKGRT